MMDKAAKAARAFWEMLDAFYRAMMTIVLMALALVGIRPKWTGGTLARTVAQEMSGVAEEPRSVLGESVKERALQLRGMAPSAVLVPLAEPIEAWLQGLSQADLKTVTGMPASTLEQHVTSGEAGALKSLGFVRTTAPAPSRTIADTPSRKAAAAVDAAHRFDVADLATRFSPNSPVMRPR